MRALRLLIHTRRHPSAVLLLVQLLGMLLYPFIEKEPAGHTAFNVFGIIVLSLTIRMVRRTPGETRISVALAVPIVILLALQTFYDLRSTLLPWSSALEALFYFYAAGSLIAYMMEDRRATTDELFAAAATFTLLAWAFTHLFLMVQELQPGTFAAAVNGDGPRSWSELNYLSFALLSSTGIGEFAERFLSIRGWVGASILANRKPFCAYFSFAAKMYASIGPVHKGTGT